MKDVIYKHALLNAAEFDGKANPNAVLGKVLSEKPELKSDIKGLMKLINETIIEVNKMGSEKIKLIISHLQILEQQ